jgi:hypothetical protein
MLPAAAGLAQTAGSRDRFEVASVVNRSTPVFYFGNWIFHRGKTTLGLGSQSDECRTVAGLGAASGLGRCGALESAS